MRTEAETERDTLTRKRAYEIAEELVSKPMCASNLVCDKCPLSFDPLEDCVVYYIRGRLEELGVKGERFVK